MGYKVIVNEYSNLQGLNSTKVLVQEYAAIGTKTTKVIVVEDTNIGTAAYNEAKAAAVTATNAANQATSVLTSAAKKDYVDNELTKKVNKSGDTITGNLNVNANINTNNLFSSGSITANTTTTSSGLRLSSNGSGYSEIVPRRAGEADFVWSGGIRYYNNGNFWAIGTNRIYHDAYAPRLTSIGDSTDLNSVSVPVKTLSLSHFRSDAANKPNTSNNANSILNISSWETGNYAHQVAFSSDGKMYNRYNNNITWSDWGQVYTSSFKPTAIELGVVRLTGDTMTGVLNVPRLEISGSAAGITYGSNKNIIRSGTGTAIVIGNFTDTTYIDSLNGDVKVRATGSTEYKIYHEGNKPTAADVNAPVKMTFTGDLNTIRTAGHYRLDPGFTNGPSGSYQYSQMLHINGSGDTHVQILGSYSSQSLFWRGFNNTFSQGGSWNRIYHEGNKPTSAELGAAPSGYGLGETTAAMGSRSQFMAYSVTPETGEVPYNGAGWQSAYGPTRRAQIYMGATGKVLSRFSLSSTEKDNTTPWATHYTTLNKPTADELGVVNKAGDVMTGDLAAPTFKSTGNYAFVRTVDNEHGIFLSNTSDKRTIIGAATGGGVIELRPFGIGNTTARTTFNTDGTITCSGTPTASQHLSTKGYVDNEVAKLLARIAALEAKQ